MEEEKQIQNKTDEELVKLSLENQSYFLYLMKRYEKKIFRYILRISNISVEESEDVLQDIFIKVYKNLNDFDDSLKFSSWIYRIAHNETISNFRKRKARPQNENWDIDEDGVERLASAVDIEKEIDNKILKKNIYKVILSLNHKYREVLILKFLEEKDYKEISDIIKKPMGTVATWINRAKEQFRKELKKQNIKLYE